MRNDKDSALAFIPSDLPQRWAEDDREGIGLLWYNDKEYAMNEPVGVRSFKQTVYCRYCNESTCSCNNQASHDLIDDCPTEWVGIIKLS